MHEPLTAVLAVFVLQFERGTPQTEVWRALNGAASRYRFAGRWIIAVDEDIDPENCDAVFWAMAYRSQPQHDLEVLKHKDRGHGPRGPRDDGENASVLINATLKGPSAPVALPKREFMESARKTWERLGLPPLEPADAVVRIPARRLARRAGAPGPDGDVGRLFRARRDVRGHATSRRRDEYARSNSRRTAMLTDRVVPLACAMPEAREDRARHQLQRGRSDLQVAARARRRA